MTGTKFAIGLIAGALAGAVAGVLAAPRTGIESRQIVGSKAGQVKV